MHWCIEYSVFVVSVVAEIYCTHWSCMSSQPRRDLDLEDILEDDDDIKYISPTKDKDNKHLPSHCMRTAAGSTDAALTSTASTVISSCSVVAPRARSLPLRKIASY